MSDYFVTTIWWPEGWEPNDPLDVPNCVGFARDETPNEPLDYERAVAAVRGLNRQNMARPGATWHAIGQLEGGCSAPPGRAIPTGQLRIVEPAAGGGKGDCSHCPARSFPCAAGS